jgi:hypothetical protein
MRTKPDEIDRLRKRAVRLRKGLTAACWFLLALLVSERLAYAGAWRGAFDAGEGARQAVLAIPSLIYLAALWQLRQVAAAAAGGDLFGRAVVRGLKRVGALLAAGAAVTILVMPLLTRMLGGTVERLIDADIATLILGALGLGLLFLGSLVERAGLAQRELEEFF